jgi:carbonic anhydrase
MNKNHNIKSLAMGHKRFQQTNFKHNEDRFKQLVDDGQHPKALFIGCSDSRVGPEIITGSVPGELFIVRNIGNFVAPYKPDEEYHATASAIEYAVGVLDITDIIICGHSHCGAIESLYKEIPYSEDILHTIKWLELGADAKRFAISQMPNASSDELKRFTEKASVLFQLDNIMTYPIVKNRVENGELFLHGWYYDIDNGAISYYDDGTDEFLPLNDQSI